MLPRKPKVCWGVRRFGVRLYGYDGRRSSPCLASAPTETVKDGARLCTDMPTRQKVSVDGDEVVAVHHEAETDAETDDDTDADRWIFFSHGFVSDKAGSYVGRCERAAAEGYEAVRFDHRGCGESDLSFGEQNLSTRVADLRAVIEHFEPSSCVLFGSSFGGKVVFHVAVDDSRIEAVGGRAPVTYTEPFEKYRQTDDGGGRGGGWGSVADDFFEDLENYDFAKVETELDVPVVVFHGRDDTTVNIEHTIDAVAALETDATLHAYAGEGHSFSREAETRLRDSLFGWLSVATRR